MGYNVIWSDEAESSFQQVIDDLLFRWSEREAINFINRTEEIISNVSKSPYLFRAYYKDPAIRHGILHKNTTMFYKVMEDSKTIRIMLFWATRTNPNKLPDKLK